MVGFTRRLLESESDNMLRIQSSFDCVTGISNGTATHLWAQPVLLFATTALNNSYPRGNRSLLGNCKASRHPRPFWQWTRTILNGSVAGLDALTTSPNSMALPSYGFLTKRNGLSQINCYQMLTAKRDDLRVKHLALRRAILSANWINFIFLPTSTVLDHHYRWYYRKVGAISWPWIASTAIFAGKQSFFSIFVDGYF